MKWPRPGHRAKNCPKADHNLLAALENPERGLTRLAVVFLRAAGNHPRSSLRLDLTREIFMEQGINTDKFTARGDHPFNQQWTALLLGTIRRIIWLWHTASIRPAPTGCLRLRPRPSTTAGPSFMSNIRIVCAA